MIKKENETELHDGLFNILKEHLIWNKAHLDCFIGMLFSLLHLKHVNLTQLALAFPSDAKLSSRYRRLQRFFQKVSFDYDAIALLLMKNFGFYGKHYYLTLDRTNWKWGKSNLNILTLGVVYKGIAIPILWDREFIGEEWWTWLTNASIPYLIRIKKNRCSKSRKSGEFFIF